MMNRFFVCHIAQHTRRTNIHFCSTTLSWNYNGFFPVAHSKCDLIHLWYRLKHKADRLFIRCVCIFCCVCVVRMTKKISCRIVCKRKCDEWMIVTGWSVKMTFHDLLCARLSDMSVDSCSCCAWECCHWRALSTKKYTKKKKMRFSYDLEWNFILIRFTFLFLIFCLMFCCTLQCFNGRNINALIEFICKEKITKFLIIKRIWSHEIDYWNYLQILCSPLLGNRTGNSCGFEQINTNGLSDSPFG